MENREENLLADFNDYLIMLAQMDKVGIRRKIVLMEGFIHKIKTSVNKPEMEKRLIRLPNDDTYFENEIDMGKFDLIEEFDQDLYGNYNGGVVFIKKNV